MCRRRALVNKVQHVELGKSLCARGETLQMPDVPDQTWLTARVRDYLTVHGIAYDPKEHHMELVRRAQKREPLRGAAVPDASWPTADIRAWLRERRVDFDQAVHLELVLLARRHGTGSEETAVKTYRTLPMSTRQQWVP
eukprot:3150456-Prymnesium_polylepis.1